MATATPRGPSGGTPGIWGPPRTSFDTVINPQVWIKAFKLVFGDDAEYTSELREAYSKEYRSQNETKAGKLLWLSNALHVLLKFQSRLERGMTHWQRECLEFSRGRLVNCSVGLRMNRKPRAIAVVSILEQATDLVLESLFCAIDSRLEELDAEKFGMHDRFEAMPKRRIQPHRRAAKRARTEEDVCCVCLEEPSDTMTVFPCCGKQLHTECARRWVYEHGTCPHCRSTV